LPVLLLSSSVVLGTALVTMNVQRQYPKFWVAQIPPQPPVPAKTEADKVEAKEQVLRGESDAGSPHDTLRDVERGPA